MPASGPTGKRRTDVATIHYQLTYNELLRAAFRRRLRRPVFLAIVGMLLLMALSLALTGPPGSAYALVFLGLALLHPVVLYIALATALARAPWLTAATSLEFDEDGV